MEISLVRNLNKNFNLKKFILLTSIISISITCLITLIAFQIYKLDIVEAYFLAFGGFLLALIILLSSIFRASLRFLKGQICLQFWKILFFIVIGIASILQPSIIINLSFINLLRIFIIFFLLGFIPFFLFKIQKYLEFNNPNRANSEEFPIQKVFKEGLFFWGIIWSIQILNVLDRWLIPKILNYEILANYSIHWWLIGAIVVPIQAGIGYTLMPQLIKSNLERTKILIKNYIFFIFFLIILIWPFAIILVRPIMNFLFNTKYFLDINLLFLLFLLGMIKLFYIIPSSVIGGKGKTKDLNLLNKIGWLGLFLSILTSIMLGLHIGIIGIVLGIILGWLIRLIGGILISKKILFPRISFRHS